MIYRGNELKCEKSLLVKLEAKHNIEVIYNSNVTKIIGNDEKEKIIINNDTEVLVSGMFISIGMDAQNEIVKDLLPLSEKDYIISDDGNTSREGIFVAGDCREKKLRPLTTAVSDGALAATLAIKYLEK